MGRGNEDWSQGKIYRIISNNPEITICYYGSTCQKLCRRMSSHRAAYKAWCAGKKKSSYAIFPYFKQYGIEQFHIELVEDFSCDNEQQLLTQENIYIRGFDCCNKKSAITTPEEKKEQARQWNLDNAEYVKQQRLIYARENKEALLAQRKIHNPNYQDDENNRAKEYREKCKADKMTCICGCKISRTSLSKHLKTKKHISLVQDLK
jgi:hypothetical protein